MIVSQVFHDRIMDDVAVRTHIAHLAPEYKPKVVQACQASAHGLFRHTDIVRQFFDGVVAEHAAEFLIIPALIAADQVVTAEPQPPVDHAEYHPRYGFDTFKRANGQRNE